MKAKKLRELLFLVILFASLSFKAKGGEELIKIEIIIGETVIHGILNDSKASLDLSTKLPLRIKLNRHENREYYSFVNLEKNDLTQDGYEIGDIAYWASGGSLVLFYDKGYTGDLIILGKMTSGLEAMRNFGQSAEAIIRKRE